MTKSGEIHATQRQMARLRPLLSISIILLAVVGLAFVVRAVPPNVLGELRLKTIPWWSLPLIALLQLVFLWLAADIWRRVVGLTTQASVSIWSSYLQLAVVAVGKYVPGKVWGFIARAGEMYRQRIPVHLAVSSSIIEQVLVIGGALLVAIVAALMALPQYWIATMVIGSCLVVATGMASSKIPDLTKWLLRRRKVELEAAQLPRPGVLDVVRVILMYAALWLLSGLIFASIYYSLFDTAITYEGIAALTLANTAGIVLGFFAFFVPGGIGVREAVATFVLTGFVPLREALLAAVCYRAWLILTDGLNALLILGREASVVRRITVTGDRHAE